MSAKNVGFSEAKSQEIAHRHKLVAKILKIILRVASYSDFGREEFSCSPSSSLLDDPSDSPSE